MKKLFISSFFINALVMIIHFTTGILSARYLGPEGRGELAVVMRWTGLFGLLMTIGLPSAVTFLGKQQADKQREFLGSYLVLGTCCGIVGAAIGWLTMPWVLADQSKAVVTLICVTLLGLPTVLLADGLIGTMTTLNRFGRVLFLRIFSPIGTLALLIALIESGRYTVSSYTYANFAWGLIFFVLNAALTFTVCRPSFKLLSARSRELLKKGKQIYMPSLVTLFGDNLDQIVISLFLTPIVLGYYTVAGSIGSIFPSILSGTLAVFLLPKLMELRGDYKRRKVEQIHGSMFFGSIVITAIAALLLPIVLPFLYGRDFTASVVMGEIMLICTPFRIGYNVLTNFISSEDQFKLVTRAEIVGLAVGTIGTIGLLKIGEGVGASVGVVLATIAKWTYIAFQAKKLGISIRELMKSDLGYLIGTVRNRLIRQSEKV